MTDFDTDICVVGGGPAGLTLALMMLRSGVRVTVIERSRSLAREYRGEILQPGGMMLLDQLGVLAGARARGCCDHDRFQLVDRGRTLLDIDYRALPEPYNVLLSLPQQHLLEELLEQCRRWPGFTLLDGAKIRSLIRDSDGRVTGVGTDTDVTVGATVVVGADGRYSKTRRLAGIENDRLDVFDLDVLWFKLPLNGRPVVNGQIFHAGGSPVLAYRSWPDNLQIGWTLPHKGYSKIASGGIDAVRAGITAAVPPYADLIAEHIRSLGDVSLLDVFAATAKEWVRDGLMLIGDAAHTHSPLGAQGLNLAVQDAAVAHPILLRAVRTGDASATALGAFVTARKPDVDAVTKLQVMQSHGLLSQSKVAAFMRPKVARIFPYTPLPRKILGRIAYGNRGIAVRTDLFTSQPATATVTGEA